MAATWRLFSFGTCTARVLRDFCPSTLLAEAIKFSAANTYRRLENVGFQRDTAWRADSKGDTTFGCSIGGPFPGLRQELFVQ